LIEVTTPLCKAYPSDEAWWLLGEAIQVYGGYGYCEEYPVAQIARDVKIYSIWEGTNFIQAMDLVGRKWGMRKGASFAAFIQEMREFHEANKDNAEFAAEFAVLGQALDSYAKIQKAIFTYMGEKKISMMPLYARRILTATSQLYCGRLILDQALVASARAKEVGPDHYDYKFYTGKVASARYYLMNVVPNVSMTADVIAAGDTSALDISVDAFEY